MRYSILEKEYEITDKIEQVLKQNEYLEKDNTKWKNYLERMNIEKKQG